MNRRKETRTNQAAGQMLDNQTLKSRLTFLTYGTSIDTSFMKKSEATANDAIIAFNQNAKLYLSKMFYPIVFAALLIVVFASTNELAAQTFDVFNADKVARVGMGDPGDYKDLVPIMLDAIK
ncbi:MAG: hypothetical protein LBO69_02670 [Ignavibacteria bacterium]|jgi:hypothetical protein|nr:hypothetical protein [Ignavibacteria bacterium]